MRVRLVSQDTELRELCRQVIGEIGEHALELASQGADGFGDYLTIWDYAPGLPLTLEADWRPARHLFLVWRSEIEAFRQAAPCEEAMILLKPLTRVTLTDFLRQVFRAANERASTADSLRADRDQLLQCVISANLKLQEYDQDRTNFLARAVHDFRAPLTAITGYCGLLLSEAFGPITAAQRDVIERMQHSGTRLSRMASAMFQLSAGRRITTRPELRRGDIQECLEQALHEIGPQAKEKQISVTIDLEQETDLFFAPERIEELLINLLDNACRFTPRNGEIRICGYPYFWDRLSIHGSDPRHQSISTANSYRLDISNSGTCIPSEHLKNIFEEFTSYGGGQDRSSGGLGLAICRMIAQQHEGHIWAENTPMGPRFSFVLPMSAGRRGVNQEKEMSAQPRFLI
jgi:signal transduction histidine kinase